MIYRAEFFIKLNNILCHARIVFHKVEQYFCNARTVLHKVEQYYYLMNITIFFERSNSVLEKSDAYSFPQGRIIFYAMREEFSIKSNNIEYNNPQYSSSEWNELRSLSRIVLHKVEQYCNCVLQVQFFAV